MAMACFRLVTFLPLRPLFSLPRFISCISCLTCLPAAELYLFLEDFLALEDFFELEDLLARFVEVDFFALFFFVAIDTSPALNWPADSWFPRNASERLSKNRNATRPRESAKRSRAVSGDGSEATHTCDACK